MVCQLLTVIGEALKTPECLSDGFPSFAYGTGVPASGVAQLLGSRTAWTTSSMAAIITSGCW